jgi:hypothetical protein
MKFIALGLTGSTWPTRNDGLHTGATFPEAFSGRHSFRGASPLCPLHFTFSQKVGEIIGQANSTMNDATSRRCAMIVQPNPWARIHRSTLRLSMNEGSRSHQYFIQGGLGMFRIAKPTMNMKTTHPKNAGSHTMSTYEAASRQAHLMCRLDLQRAFATPAGPRQHRLSCRVVMCCAVSTAS